FSRYLFFFSSRRRHTSFSRDWSSDVCSSDLAFERQVFLGIGRKGDQRAGARQRQREVLRKRHVRPPFCPLHPRSAWRNRRTARRSEERRVGKECRARWWRFCLYKKK